MVSIPPPLRALRFAWIAAALAASVWSAPALAQDAVSITVEPRGDYARVLMTWPEELGDADLDPEVEVENGVLVVRSPRAMRTDPERLAAALPGRAALARLDPDGQALRIALTRELRAHVSRSYNLVAIDLIEPERDDPPDILSPREEAERLAAIEAREQAVEQAERELAPPVRLPLRLRIAQAAEYSRILFDWGEPLGFDLQRTPDGVELRFERDAVPEMAQLRVNPPRGVVTAEARHAGDRLQVAFTLDEGMTARAWSDGASVIVDVMSADADVDSVETLAALAVSMRAAGGEEAPPVPPVVAAQASEEGPEDAHAAEEAHAAVAEPPAPDPHETPTPTAEPDPTAVADIPLVNTRALDASGVVEEHTVDPFALVETPAEPAVVAANPVPASGVVRATVASAGAEALVTFPWDAPVGAAAFRRGDTIWLVFDASTTLAIDELRRANLRQFVDPVALVGETYSAVRFTAPPTTQVSVVADGATWTFAFGEAAAAPPRPANVERRGDENTAPYLFATLPTVTRVHAVPDDEVGDVLLVATALGPAQGLPSDRTFLEITALASAHGLGFERAADQVTARAAPGEGVVIERRRGLALSYGAQGGEEAERAAANLEAKPGFIDFAGWSAPPEDFVAEHDRLMRAIATGVTPAQDRMALARLLVAQQLGPEALGVLRMAVLDEPRLLDDPKFRALRGVANVLARRYKDAERDLNASPLAGDTAAAPWRGYVAVQFGDWREARRQFSEGAVDLYELRPDWRARILIASAEAALELNDLPAARSAIDAAYAEQVSEEERLHVKLAETRYLAATDEPERALVAAREVAAASYEPLEVAALYEATRLRLELGEITTADAAEELEALRYRWRGDDVELNIVRTLGAMYVEMGEFRRGMQIMDAAAARFPEAPTARRVYADMSAAFRELYLDGAAETLDPIEALALWYEFNDLTPIGADGDRMLRRLADRLVDFDLLPQAAELLAYQVDNRLRGVPRAQVATDLAAIYLMDKRSEDALNALRRTRIAGTPMDLVAQRRLLEARALADLGRFDLALELLDTDRSGDAASLRADVAWEARMWPLAAELLEGVVGEAWREEEPLSETLQNTILRSVIAYSLAGDREGVNRLAARFNPKMAGGPYAASWRTVTSEPNVDGVVLRDVAGRIAEMSTFDAFLDEFRARRAREADEAAALAEQGAQTDAAAATPGAAEDEGEVL